MKIVNQLDECRWADFVRTHPDGNIFHTPEMFQVFSRARNHQPAVWAAVRETGEILALFTPVKVFLFNGLFRSFTTRAISYGGVLCAPGAEGEKALARLLHTYSEQSASDCLYTEMRNLSNPESLRQTLISSGFEFEEHLNYLIELVTPIDALFTNIGSRTRKHIRQGLRSGEVKMEEVKDRDKLKTCYEILSKTYKTAGVPLADISLFESAFDVLHPKNMIRFTLAKVGGRPAATSVELLFKHIMYGWYGGLDRSYGRYNPNEMMMWDVLQWGVTNGYAVYDFGGAGRPDEHSGVRDFKAKFGGSLVNFGRNKCVHAPVKLKLSELIYRFLRKYL